MTSILVRYAVRVGRRGCFCCSETSHFACTRLSATVSVGTTSAAIAAARRDQSFIDSAEELWHLARPNIESGAALCPPCFQGLHRVCGAEDGCQCAGLIVNELVWVGKRKKGQRKKQLICTKNLYQLGLVGVAATLGTDLQQGAVACR